MYKIMLVEDDPSLCSKVAEGLARWGFDTVMAENFQDILRDFAQTKPHLVVLDINLPFFDGFFWFDTPHT